MISFRAFCESPDYCNLDLSPLMAAIADAMDGSPVSLDDDACVRHFGCKASEIPAHAFRICALRAGARAGKSSRLAAPLALYLAWTVPLPDLRPGEIASVPIVCPDRDLAALDIGYVRGFVESSAILRAAFVSETADYVQIKRPDGATVQIRVFAASRGGRSVRGKTLAGAILDECAFFLDADSGTVNDRDILQAILPRVVAGGRVLLASTPWLADIGILEAHIKRDFGAHARSLAVTGDTFALRPDFDADGSIRADLELNDPEAYSREILAIPMGGGASGFFDSQAIELCTEHARAIELAPGSGRMFAGVDIGLVRDSSALVIVSETDGIVSLAHTSELHPSKGNPLALSFVVDQFAAELKRYGVNSIMCDPWYMSEVAPLWNARGVKLVTAPGGQAGKATVHVTVRTMFNEGRVRIPSATRLVQQLRSIVSKPAPGGGVTISSPRSRTVGHSDTASAFLLAVYAARPRKKTFVGTIEISPLDNH